MTGWIIVRIYVRHVDRREASVQYEYITGWQTGFTFFILVDSSWGADLQIVQSVVVDIAQALDGGAEVCTRGWSEYTITSGARQGAQGKIEERIVGAVAVDHSQYLGVDTTKSSMPSPLTSPAAATIKACVASE